MKTDILKVIFPNFREDKYLSIENVSINNHWNPTLSINHTIFISRRNVLECLNKTNILATIKLRTQRLSW